MSLKVICGDSLNGLTHGFFTRKGGVSKGIYAGLNCGRGSDDLPSNVEANRTLVSAKLDVNPTSLLSVWQCHSAEVTTVTTVFNGAPPKVDAMVTTTPGIALGVMSADCAPVLFADAQAKVVAAAHSGWKGALGGVLEATLDAMTALGARQITAIVGPCISQRAYEVGPDFFEQFLSEDDNAEQFFAGGKGDRMQFDLPGFVLKRLRDAGAVASWTGHCTYSDPESFFSYRRNCHEGETDYGRLISAIRL